MFCSSKSTTYVIIFLVNFLTGIEYAVIFPTALQFLKRYGGGEFELGLCLSAYSFSSLFSSPLMGKWSDSTNNTKLILIFANIWQIAGSLMYFFGISTDFIIAGRLVAGVGSGIIGCLFSEIVKTTLPEERSKHLSKIMIGRQLGMIIGPAFNFILYHIHVDIGPFLLDNLSAPGLLMAASWSILEIGTIFFYKNLHEFTQSPSQVDDETTPIAINTSTATSYNSISADDQEEASPAEENAEKTPLVNSPNLNHSSNGYDPIRVIDNAESGPFLLRLYNEYVRDEMVAVLATTFTVFLMQTCLETLVTPFTRDYFGWDDLKNSIMYGCAGLEIMIVFLLLGYLSKRFQDRTLVLVGLIGNLSTLVFLIVYLPRAVPNRDTFIDYALFMVPFFGNVFSLPFIVLGSISLLSKISSLANQGLTQGIRRTVVGIACILGPNWAGIFYKQWYFLIGTLIGLLTISLIMIIISFRRLNAQHSRN